MRWLQTAWDIIRKPNRDNSQVALAIAFIFWVTGAAVILAFLYGTLARTCASLCGIADQLAGGVLAVLTAAGAFSVGGFLGLLFGAPNWGGAAPVAQGDKPSGSGSTRVESSAVRPNTSLERIADWLTTMIVGLSLVHLPTIVAYTRKVGLWVTGAISQEASVINGTPGIVIVVAFAFAGFVMLYLWCLRFLPSEIRDTYSQQIQHVQEEVSRLRKDVIAKPLFAVPSDVLRQVDEMLAEGGVDEATRAEIQTRYAGATRGSDEPFLEFGPGELPPYRLQASVTDEGGLFRVSVVFMDEGKGDGEIYWLLHNTFTPDVVKRCPTREGEAKYESIVTGAFWIAAVLAVKDKPAVRLAIDLGQAPGATDAFRES